MVTIKVEDTASRQERRIDLYSSSTEPDISTGSGGSNMSG